MAPGTQRCNGRIKLGDFVVQETPRLGSEPFRESHQTVLTIHQGNTNGVRVWVSCVQIAGSQHAHMKYNHSNHDFPKMNISVAAMVDAILDVWDRSEVIFVVQWRSRFIEVYASWQIAESNKQFERRNTSGADAITVDRSDLPEYAERWFDFYYDEVRTVRNLNHEVVEYNRYLVDPLKQVQTMKRIMRLMGVPITMSSRETIH